MFFERVCSILLGDYWRFNIRFQNDSKRFQTIPNDSTLYTANYYHYKRTEIHIFLNRKARVYVSFIFILVTLFRLLDYC
jgi:hypothetical protein